jgi:exonuclease SbcD
LRKKEKENFISAQISAAIFPKEIDYVALGHIHSAQKIANCEHIRYAGSPLAMSFSEKSSAKKMILLETGNELKIQEIQIPEFQKTLKISGDLAIIRKKIEELKTLDTSVWLEVEYKGEEEFNLKDILYECIKNSKIEILKFKNQNLLNKYAYQESTEKNLEDLTPDTIFENILINSPYAEKNKQALLACYHEILSQLQEEDSNE